MFGEQGDEVGALAGYLRRYDLECRQPFGISRIGALSNFKQRRQPFAVARGTLLSERFDRREALLISIERAVTDCQDCCQ